jgi:hypothetical protein
MLGQLGAMRELPILKPDGSLDDNLVGIVQSHMIYPNDLGSTEEDIFVHRYRRLTGYRDTELGRYLEEQWQKAKLGGMQAASILYTIVQFSTHRPDLDVGVRKSQFMVQDELEHQYRDARKEKKSPRNLARSERTVDKFWLEYKDSAHLWAALMLLMNENSNRPGVDFRLLLSLSEQMVRLAEPLVSDWKPWRVPGALHLPNAKLNIFKPDDDDVARAMRYRAQR